MKKRSQRCRDSQRGRADRYEEMKLERKGREGMRERDIEIQREIDRDRRNEREREREREGKLKRRKR